MVSRKTSTLFSASLTASSLLGWMMARMSFMAPGFWRWLRMARFMVTRRGGGVEGTPSSLPRHLHADRRRVFRRTIHPLAGRAEVGVPGLEDVRHVLLRIAVDQ